MLGIWTILLIQVVRFVLLMHPSVCSPKDLYWHSGLVKLLVLFSKMLIQNYFQKSVVAHVEFVVERDSVEETPKLQQLELSQYVDLQS